MLRRTIAFIVFGVLLNNFLFTSVSLNSSQNAAALAPQQLEVITPENIEQIRTLVVISPEDEFRNSVFEVAFDSTSDLLAYVTLNEIVTWNVTTQNRLWRIPALQGTNVVFSPDGQSLVASSYPEIYLWRNWSNISSWEKLYRSESQRVGDSGDIQFSEDGQEIVAIIRQNYGIFRWQTTTGELLFEDFEPAMDERTMIDDAILTDNSQIAAIFGRSADTIEFLRTDDGTLLSSVAIRNSLSESSTAPMSVSFLTFTPDNERLLAVISASDLSNPLLLLLDVSSNIVEEIQYDYQIDWTAGAFNPDGTLLVLANAADGMIYSFGGITNEWLTRIESEQEGLTSLAFSPDGKFLASASYDGTVRLWGVREE